MQIQLPRGNLLFKALFLSFPQKGLFFIFAQKSNKNQALEEFQRNYAKKALKEQNPPKEEDPEENENERLPVIGVKRPPVLEFKVEEKYVLIESEDKGNRTEEKKPENLHPNNSTNKFSENEYIEFLDEEEELKDSKSEIINVPSESQNNGKTEGTSQKRNEDINNKDEEIEKNLMNFWEREEESFSSNIMNNLRSLKKQKIEKKEGTMKIEEDVKDQKQNLHLEENLDVGDLFNWKKKKLF